MMPRPFSFLMGLAAGAMLCYGATNYHIVRAQDGFHVVEKVHAELANSYVDVRQFGASDWSNHPDLAAAIVKENKQELIQGAAAAAIQQGIDQVLPEWSRP
jgi:hypothetical protein